MGTLGITGACANPNLNVYRRAFIKRKSLSTGLFESTWTEITSDIKKWGSVKMTTDVTRPGKLTIDGIRLSVQNTDGKFNAPDNESSLWYGYGSQQRTLVKVSAGFYRDTQSSSLIWNRLKAPGTAYWDEDRWDQVNWDQDDVIFTGIISGDVILGDNQEVQLQVKPLMQVFKDFPAPMLTGLNDSITASGFMTLLRDQTDGSGNFLFRPFFGDTTTYWDISATSNIFSAISTNTSDSLKGKSVFDVMESLAEAERFLCYIDNSGVFRFTPNTASASVDFQFYGVNKFNSNYGHGIKSIGRYSYDQGRYYSRVEVKFREESTTTSYSIVQSGLTITSANAAWQYGQKSLNIENLFIPTSTAAATIAQSIYTDVTSLRRVLEFKSSFVPHLNLLDKISVYIDTSDIPSTETLWDLNDWDTELTWDDSRGNAIILEGQEFKFLSIDINLDTFETSYVAREL